MRFKVVCICPERSRGNVLDAHSMERILLSNSSYVAEGNKRLMILDALLQHNRESTNASAAAYDAEKGICASLDPVLHANSTFC